MSHAAITPVAVLSARSWLEGVRRDPRVPHSAFRLGHSVAVRSKEGRFAAPLKAIAASAGMNVVSASQGLDRLAALGHLVVNRQGSGAPIELELSQHSSRQPVRA